MKDKFTTKKGDLNKIEKLTKEELEQYQKTGELPDRIKNILKSKDDNII